MPSKIPNDGRFHVQFRIYDKATVEFLSKKDGQIAAYMKELIRRDMEKSDKMTADGKAMVICSVLANNPGMDPEKYIALVESIIKSAEEF